MRLESIGCVMHGHRARLIYSTLLLLLLFWGLSRLWFYLYPDPSAAPTPSALGEVKAEAQKVSAVDGMTLVYIPAGEFRMGSSAASRQAQQDELPLHTVYLDAYWIDLTEVTNAMYARCSSSGKCKPPHNQKSYTRDRYYGNPAYADYPVVYVDREQAEGYCAWAGRRLPTEAEWEKAARGTDSRVYPWGNQDAGCRLANFDISGSDKQYCAGDTLPAGAVPAGVSPYGAMDMAGNAWEWVADWYGETYYQEAPHNNPAGPLTGDYGLLRGGSWSSEGNTLRAAHRFKMYPTANYDDWSFRCASSP